MFGILPLIFALVIAQTAEGLTPTRPLGPLPPWQASLVQIAACIAIWAVAMAVGARLLRRRQSPRLLALWDGATTGASLGIFALWCYELGWSHLAGSTSLVQLAPYIALLMPAWYAGGIAWSPPGQSHRARELLATRLRFGLLPALVALALFDLAQLLILQPLLALDTGAATPTWLSLTVSLASFATVFTVLLLLPAIVVRLWAARPLPPGPARELLEDGCRRAGFAAKRIMTWPAAAGRLYNAAVLGMLPRFRYVLFSTDLLRELPPEQITAVLGHELGHIRHRHLWIYLLFLFAAVVWSWTLSVPLAGFLGTLDGFESLGAEARQGIAIVALFLFFLRGVFGVLSRACERQADLAGAELAGGTTAMRDALRNVAVLSGQPLDAPSWRHHSIQDRAAYLERIEEDATLARRHHALVRRMLLGTALLLVCGLVAAIATPLLRTDPAAYLERHPAVAAAIDAAAEDTEWRPLSRRLGDADASEAATLRQVIARHIQAHMTAYDAARSEGRATISEAAALYQIRGLLYALAAHPTGDPRFDAFTLNNAAYAAVAGTADPSPEDLEVARSALPDLNRAAHRHNNSAYHDTVGAVLFRLGDRDQARKHFSIAAARAPADTPSDRLRDFQNLLQRRLAACNDPDASLPLETVPSGGDQD